MNAVVDHIAEAVAALTDNGDVFEIDDTQPGAAGSGRRQLRLHIDVDVDAHLNDYDCYGSASQYSYRYVDGRRERPAGMDGSARKIEVDRGDYMWWQPSEDMKSKKVWTKAWTDADLQPPCTYEEAFRSHVDQATELLRWGFSLVGVSLWESVTDSQGGEHWVQVNVNYLGGIDSTAPEALADIVESLIHDLEGEVGPGY